MTIWMRRSAVICVLVGVNMAHVVGRLLGRSERRHSRFNAMSCMHLMNEGRDDEHD
ncbi:MAG: hypothetical protein AAFU66_07130 [Pseudomonadota bacterium]